MSTFTWSDAARARVVPGCTVYVSGSPNYDSGRYTLLEGATLRFAMLRVNGVAASVPWARCDPNTLRFAPEA